MSSFSSSRGGPTDDRTEVGGRRYVHITNERESRRQPVVDTHEANFFTFQRPRNRFASLQLWQPSTTTPKAPMFVLNPQPRLSSVQKTVTSMRPLKPSKNRMSTIGKREHGRFNMVVAPRSNKRLKHHHVYFRYRKRLEIYLQTKLILSFGVSKR